jgi:hypothetical protein
MDTEAAWSAPSVRREFSRVSKSHPVPQGILRIGAAFQAQWIGNDLLCPLSTYILLPRCRRVQSACQKPFDERPPGIPDRCLKGHLKYGPRIWIVGIICARP